MRNANRISVGDRVIHLGTPDNGARRGEVGSVICIHEGMTLKGYGRQSYIFEIDIKSNHEDRDSIGALHGWIRKIEDQSTNETTFSEMMVELADRVDLPAYL